MNRADLIDRIKELSQHRDFAAYSVVGAMKACVRNDFPPTESAAQTLVDYDHAKCLLEAAYEQLDAIDSREIAA